MTDLTYREAVDLMARTCGHGPSDLLVMGGRFHCGACKADAEAELERRGDRDD